MLPAHVAHHLLRAHAQLAVYARYANRDLVWESELEDRLLDAVTGDPRLDTGAVALHQVEGARALFLERRDRHAPGAPLVVTALCVLARELLVFHRGELMLRPAAHLRWREQWSASTLIEPLRAAATALHCLEGDPRDRWWPRLEPPPRAQALVFGAPLMPPVADEDILYLRARGLHELHRHDSLSRLPATGWLVLLHEEGPELVGKFAGAPALAPLLRQARALCRALDELLHLRGPDDPEDPAQSDAIAAAWSALRTPFGGARAPEEAPLPDPLGAEGDDLRARHDRRLARDRARLQGALRALMSPAPGLPPRALTVLGPVLHALLICRHHLEAATVHPPQGARGLDRFKRRYVDHPHLKAIPGSHALRWRQAAREGGVASLEVKTGPGGGLAAQAEAWLQAVEAELAAGAEASDHGLHLWSSAGLLARLTVDGPPPADRSRPLVEGDRARERPALRLVVHFLRVADPEPSPEAVAPPPRYAGLRAKVRDQALELREVLDDPDRGPVFVGIDIASDELAAPAEAFAPAFRLLRAPWALSRPGRSLALRSLVATVHAGEEFEHLIAGMRQVDEHLRFLHLHAGDRIGHALALGLEPAAWRLACGGGVSQRRQGRLDDLVWLLHQVQSLPAHAAHAPALRAELSTLCQKIYGEVHDPALLFEAWTLRDLDPEEVRRPGEPLGRGRPGEGPAGRRAEDPCDCGEAARRPGADVLDALEPEERERRADAADPSPDPLRAPALAEARARLRGASAPARQIWERTAWEVDVRRRGDERVAVPDAPQLDGLLRDVQDRMLRELADKDICIEACPSSNLAIAHLGRLAAHPVFRWLPVRPEDRAGLPLPRVVICADDPAIFCTELAHEYALLAEAARQRGHSPREVRAWLDELRREAERLAAAGRDGAAPPGRPFA